MLASLRDQPFAEIEVMKMNMPLLAPENGVLSHLKPAGSVMEPGDILAGLELDDPSKVSRAELYGGELPRMGAIWPSALDDNSHHALATAISSIRHVMAGYTVSAADRIDAIHELVGSLADPTLPSLEVIDLLSEIKHTLPYDLYDEIVSECDAFKARMTTKPSKVHRLGEIRASMSKLDLTSLVDLAPEEDDDALTTRIQNEQVSAKLTGEFCATISRAVDAHATKDAQVAENARPLTELVSRYSDGLNAYALEEVLDGLLRAYADPEAAFAELELSDAAEKDDVLQELRVRHVGDLAKVYDIALSHAGVRTKNEVALVLLETVEITIRRERDSNGPNSTGVVDRAVALLKHIASLKAPSTTEVALEARQILIELQQPSTTASIQSITEKLRAIARGDAEEKARLIDSTEAVLHQLVRILVDDEVDSEVRSAALEVYVRRVYHAYSMKTIGVKDARGLGRVVDFTFYSEPSDSVSLEGQMAGASSFDDLQALMSTFVPTTGTGGGPGSVNSFHAVDAHKPPTPNPPVSGASSTTLNSSTVKHTRAASNNESVGRPRSASGWDDGAGATELTVDSDRTAVEGVAPFVLRKAMLAVFSSLETLDAEFDALLDAFEASPSSAENEKPVNALHLIIKAKGKSQEELSAILTAACSSRKESLEARGVRRVTFAVPPVSGSRAVLAGHGSGFFTMRHSLGYQEDRLVRNIEPSLAFQLDLRRLSNFHIELVPLGKNSSMSRTVHVYRASPKAGPSSATRYFIRALVRNTDKLAEADDSSRDAYPGPERVLVQAIAALEAVQETTSTSMHNHIFLNILGDAVVSPEEVEDSMRYLARRYASRLTVARVAQVEIKVNARLYDDSPGIPVRLVASNPTGFALRVDTYVEAGDPARPGKNMFYSISDDGVSGALAAMGLDGSGADQASESNGELHGEDVSAPYKVSSKFDDKRARAIAAGTCYAYDIPALFQKAVENEWRAHASKRASVEVPHASTLVRVEELILEDESTDESDEPLLEGTKMRITRRAPGSNSIAMIAWRFVVRTPQYPDKEGREIVLIANDITNRAGSFGTREDRLFFEASKYARERGLPRLYVAANSGARIGMAEEVKRVFKVQFVDEKDETKGFDYVYLDEQAYKELGPEGRKSVVTSEGFAGPDGETRYKIEAIVGEQPDLGVENLRGSGTIAGETSRAYNESFTLTYVSGRTVGIGAYLVRLGQRTIQKGTNAPILLTGYQALNSLMGKSVYSSNLQLGGPAIMFNNGVTHKCVRNDLEGVAAMLEWLSYVPSSRSASLPTTKLVAGDVCERDVEYSPDPSTPSDPRLLLTGVEGPEGWKSGLFDRGSFTEYMSGWAKTIVCGRARLGGLPVGVIVPEQRTVTAKTPADPATPDSNEQVHQQAGNVWFPDSAFKTASAIRDINGEGLPLIFLANIRGFSGGQRDMFDQVLKFGSMIVDALVDFNQPVFVYIPPYAELRGGAWVVVDPTINDEQMEMYCAPEARGGVLEPAGAASIKFRQKDMVAAMRRIDGTLIKLIADGDLQGAAAREKVLAPVYKQLALEFADAHDRPGRMLAKGAVEAVVPWREARRFFFWRLRRRVAEHSLRARIRAAASDDMSKAECDDFLYGAYIESDAYEGTADWGNDRAVWTWMTSVDGAKQIDSRISSLVASRIADEVAKLGLEDSRAMLNGLMRVIGTLGETGKTGERDRVVSTLQRGLFLLGSKGRERPPAASGEPATKK